MQGKIILITGGNDGIGKETAIGLARRGGRIVLACRNMEKAKAAQQDIKEKSDNEEVYIIPLDLSSFQSVRAAAEQFKENFNRLDVLINNAGLLVKNLQKTAEGYEMQFGVNHLGHFLLTQLLLDSLQESPAARVINVSSHSHYQGEIDFDNLRGEKNNYRMMKAYARSKLANVLFTKEFARRYPDISCHALHPGLVGTDIGNKDVSWHLSAIWSLIKFRALSPEAGARTSIYLAADPEVGKTTGLYYNHRQRVKKVNPLAEDKQLAERLWEYSEAAVQ